MSSATGPLRVAAAVLGLIALAGAALAPGDAALARGGGAIADRRRDAMHRVSTADAPRRTLYHNGLILTMEDDRPQTEALLVEDGLITALGAEAEARARQDPGTAIVDLEGRTLMPGFVDAHAHLFNTLLNEGLSLDEAQLRALQYGITSVGELFVERALVLRLQDFAASGQLRLRVSLYLVANDACGQPRGDWYRAFPPQREPGMLLHITGVKIFTDGGSCGAVALGPEWERGPGDMWMTQTQLEQAIRDAQGAGYQAAVHAIGDRAVEQAQAAFASVLAGEPNALRHRMEHVSVIQPEQLARFGELGVVPVLNGQYPNCQPFGTPAPQAAQASEWPWRALREANPGLPIAWHSDYPFLSLNPLVHLAGFVSRLDTSRYYTCPPPDWLADDVLPVDEALKIMTRYSAYALWRDAEAGSLAPGKAADLIVLSQSPLTTAPEDMPRIRVLLTLVGGQAMVCAPEAQALCPNFAPWTPAPVPDSRPPEAARWLVLALVIGIPLSSGTLAVSRPGLRARLKRLGGLAGVAGGALWLLNWWLALDSWENPASVWLMAATTAATALGVVGLASAGRPGRLGWMGLALSLLGAITIGAAFILSEWFHIEAGWFVLMLGLMSHTFGLAAFGLANLRARVLPRLNALPLVIGVVSGPIPVGASFTIAQNAEWPLALLLIGLGLGWMALGGLLLSAKAPTANLPEAIGMRPHDGGQTLR